MKKIVENYLVMTRQSDFNNKLLRYFYQRLGLFLSYDVIKPPAAVFTSKIKIIADFYNDPKETYYGSAFYDEDTNTVIFDATRYNKNRKNFKYKDTLDTINKEIGEYKNYPYVIPLADIYHELIHSIQFQCGVYDFTDMVEATDECFTYFITGPWNHIEYINATLALWYIARYELKISKTGFYTFIRNCIIKKDYHKRYFLTNKNFIKLLGKEYDGDFSLFMRNFKVNFFDEGYLNDFKLEMEYIHNLIFYKY